MKEYSIDQLHNVGLISKALRRVLIVLGCKTSKDILSLSENHAAVRHIDKSYKLKDELFALVNDINNLKNTLPKLAFSDEAIKSSKKPNKGSKPSSKLTVGGYTESLLNQSEQPIKMEDLVEKIKEFLPDTNIISVRANLTGDPSKRFVTFLDGYVGLRNKTYDSRYIVYSVENKKKQYAEQRILEFMSFIEEKHRSPQPHGLEEEESLYRWFLDFTKSTSKETEEQRETFLEYLKEYEQWIFTPFEYAYKRNCEQVKWYVDENIELPGEDDEPELHSWFYFQLEHHIKHKDKRKQMFKDLLEYLEDYGMHFYDAKSAKGKSVLNEETQINYLPRADESSEAKYIRILGLLRDKPYYNEYSVHKVLLLLAISRLINKGVISTNYIILDDNLLMEFVDVCVEYKGTASSYNIALPYFYLNNEPFWTLVPAEGKTYDDIENLSQPSYDTVESCVSYAILDSELFDLLSEEESSNRLTSWLIDTYIRNVKQSPTTITQRKQSDGEEPLLMSEYREYLYSEISSKSVDSYISILNNSALKFIQQVCDNSISSLFNISSSVEIEALLTKLRSNEAFKEANKKSHNKLSAAIGKYLSFLLQKE